VSLWRLKKEDCGTIKIEERGGGIVCAQEMGRSFVMVEENI